MQSTRILLWLILAGVCAVSVGANLFAGGDSVISGVGVVAPDGSICQGMAVVVSGEGRILAVIPADQTDPQMVQLKAPEGSVITPGLHDLLGSLGATGALRAGTVLVDSEL
jgi:hypothetical protein